MDLDSLQQMKVQIRLKKADSRQSSLSAASDLPYPTQPHRTASENLGLDRVRFEAVLPDSATFCQFLPSAKMSLMFRQILLQLQTACLQQAASRGL